MNVKNLLEITRKIPVYIYAGIAIFIIGVIVLQVSYVKEITEYVELPFYDFASKLKTKPEVDNNVILVEISDVTDRQIGIFPWKDYSTYRKFALGLKLLKPRLVVWDIEFLPRGVNDFNKEVISFVKLYKEIDSIGTFSVINEKYTEECNNEEYNQLEQLLKRGIPKYIDPSQFSSSDLIEIEKKGLDRCLYGFALKNWLKFKTADFKKYLDFLTDNSITRLINDKIKNDNREIPYKDKVYLNTFEVMERVFSYTGDILNKIYLHFVKLNVLDSLKKYSKVIKIESTVNGEIFTGVNDISHLIFDASGMVGFANTPSGKYGKVRDIPVFYTLNGANILHLSFSAYAVYNNYDRIRVNSDNILFYRNDKIEEVVPIYNRKFPVDFLDYYNKKYIFVDAADIVYLGRVYDEIFYNIASNYDTLVEGVQKPLMEAGLLKEKVLKRSMISGRLHPIKFYKSVKNFTTTFRKIMMDLIAGGGSEEEIENYKQILSLVSDIENNKLERFKNLYKDLFARVNKRVVFVGGVKRGADMKSVTIGSNYPGVVVHLSSFNKLVKRLHIVKLNKIIHYIALFVFLLLSFHLLTRYGSLVSGIFIIVSLVLLFFLKVELLNKKVYLDYSETVILLFIPSAISIAVKERIEGKTKKMLKQTFQNFISKEVLDYLLQHPDKIRLGGEMKEATVFFSDLSGFTTFSEKYRPEYVITILNEYLKIITERILENRGFLDKYEGDGVMAAFGVPVEFPESARCACRAAVSIKNDLIQLQEEWHEKGLPVLKIRIGLSTGHIIAGNIGSEKRLDYTLIGDYVNLANRLEQSNKAFGTSIMIEENTYNKIKDDFYCRKIGIVKVKGKEKFVSVYELVDEKNNSNVDTTFLELFNEAIDLYLSKKLMEAKYIFEKLLKMDETDKPTRKYLELCNDLLKSSIIIKDEDLVIKLG